MLRIIGQPNRKNISHILCAIMPKYYLRTSRHIYRPVPKFYRAPNITGLMRNRKLYKIEVRVVIQGVAEVRVYLGGI